MKSALPNPMASFVKATLLISLLLFAGTPVVLSAQIVLRSQSATPGASILGQVEFSSQTSSPSGVQFDVNYDNTQISLTATLGGPAITSGKSLYVVDLAPNQKRFLIVGSNQNVIPDGRLMNLSVDISPTAPSGTYTLKLSNVFGTDPEGNPVLVVTGGDGVLTVSAGTSVNLQYTGVLNGELSFPVPLRPANSLLCPARGSVQFLCNNQRGLRAARFLAGRACFSMAPPHHCSMPHPIKLTQSYLSVSLEMAPLK